MASLTDIDGTPTSVTWQWAQGPTAGGTFANISSATSSSYTLVAADVTKYLRATANYTDPQGSSKSANATTGQIGASNAEPSFSTTPATRTLPENSGAGTDIGAAVTATESDSGDTLFYSLNGSDAGSFDIDSSNGQIKTRTGVTYDFEGSKKTYTVTVNVRDSKDSAGDANTATDDSITVTINLTNVNEAPVIASPPATESIPETALPSPPSRRLTWTRRTREHGRWSLQTTAASSPSTRRLVCSRSPTRRTSKCRTKPAAPPMNTK